MILLTVSAHIAVVLAMTDAAFLYIVVIAPLLTLLAAFGFDATVAWWCQRRQLSPLHAQRASRVMAAGGVSLVALTAGGWAAGNRCTNRRY